MAELLGRATGPCKGKGGRGHLAQPAAGFFGAHAVVGGNLTIAAGVALAMQMRGTGGIVACIFGDGACGSGALHETLNIAALWKLPLLLVCDDNGWSISTPREAALAARSPADLAAPFGIRAASVDGMDVVAVRDAAIALAAHVRDGAGPAFLWCDAERFSTHSTATRETRSRETMEAARARCPIRRLATSLRDEGALDTEAFAALERDAAGAARARCATPRRRRRPPSTRSDVMSTERVTKVFFAEAIVARSARRWRAIRASSSSARTSAGSAARTASSRGCTRASATIACATCRSRRRRWSALGVGAAAAGLRPLVSITYMDFVMLGLDPLVNYGAKLRYKTGGQLAAPVVVKCTAGAKGQGVAHSQSLEAWLAGVAGLKVVAPSTPADAYGLMVAALADGGPVVYVDHKRLFPTAGELPDAPAPVPIGRATVRRAGRDVTIATHSYMCRVATRPPTGSPRTASRARSST
jgi:hypothetical protein